MTGSHREAFPDVREWSGSPTGCPGVVGRPSWMSINGREAIPDDQLCSETLLVVRYCSGSPPVNPGVVGRPTRMSGSSRRPSQMSGSGRLTLSDVR